MERFMDLAGPTAAVAGAQSVMNDTPGFPCEEVLACLDDYLDQEQPPETTGRILAHLAVCPSCAARCEAAYRELAALRDASHDVYAPTGLLDRIARALARRPPRSGGT